MDQIKEKSAKRRKLLALGVSKMIINKTTPYTCAHDTTLTESLRLVVAGDGVVQ